MNGMGFKPSELKLPFNEFERISRQRQLDKDTSEWLSEWNMYDLMMSPMDDNTRKILRHGHYTGWFAHKRKDKKYEFLNKALKL